MTGTQCRHTISEIEMTEADVLDNKKRFNEFVAKMEMKIGDKEMFPLRYTCKQCGQSFRIVKKVERKA
jgi:hypothetical protein